MPLLEINRDPTPRQVRQFALGWLPGFCCVMAGWSVYRFGAWTAAAALVGGGLLSIVLGLAKPGWMRSVMLGWTWAAFPLGWAIAHTLMAMIYYLIVTPIGLVMRGVRRDPLTRSWDPGAETYWIRRPPPADRSSYFRQF